MKIKQLTLGILLLATIVAFFAFYVPGTKVNTSMNWYRVNCLTIVGICEDASKRPQIVNGNEVFNSKMYINKHGNLVIEHNKEFTDDSLRIKYFEKGFIDFESENRIRDKELLESLGVTDSVLIIPKGRYPVRKGLGKYIVTFEQNTREESLNKGN